MIVWSESASAEPRVSPGLPGPPWGQAPGGSGKLAQFLLNFQQGSLGLRLSQVHNTQSSQVSSSASRLLA